MRHLALFFVLLVLAPPAHAHEGETRFGPHGGELVEAGHVTVEAVFGAEELAFYFFDGQEKGAPLPASGLGTLVVGGEIRSAELTPRDGALRAPLSSPKEGTTIAVVLARLDETPIAARIERRTGPGGIPYHDHRAIHGGLVLMSGDDHAELVAEPGGRYKLWFSDAWRHPIAEEVEAALVIERDDGSRENVSLDGPDAQGKFEGTGAAKEAGRRKVHLDAKVKGVPFRTYWVLEPTRKVTGVVDMEVTEAGFLPANLSLRAGQPVHLRITRKTEATCAKDLVIPGYVEKRALPLGKAVDVTFTPRKTGELRYGCSMNQMIGGVLLVE